MNLSVLPASCRQGGRGSADKMSAAHWFMASEQVRKAQGSHHEPPFGAPPFASAWWAVEELITPYLYRDTGCFWLRRGAPAVRRLKNNAEALFRVDCIQGSSGKWVREDLFPPISGGKRGGKAVVEVASHGKWVAKVLMEGVSSRSREGSGQGRGVILDSGFGIEPLGLPWTVFCLWVGGAPGTRFD